MGGAARIFQVYYDPATRAALDPDFEPLDNVAGERPDWYEYWPIRRFFRAHALEPSSRVGFLSPLFFSKTRLSGRQVRDFVEQEAEAEVVTFSPHPCHGAVFYNVFEQGANWFPDFLEVATRFVQEVQPGVRLDQIVNDSRNTVYSNYFVAGPAFWGAWNAVCDRLFEHAEDPRSPLYAALNRPVTYAKDDGTAKPAQMKIFVLERVASLLLATRKFAIRNYPPFAMPLSAPFVEHLPEVMALDALKIAYAQSRDQSVLREYVSRRDRLAAIAFAQRPG